jgi:hypothetical protein
MKQIDDTATEAAKQAADDALEKLRRNSYLAFPGTACATVRAYITRLEARVKELEADVEFYKNEAGCGEPDGEAMRDESHD